MGMGRSSIYAGRDFSGKLSVRRVPLDRGGYEERRRIAKREALQKKYPLGETPTDKWKHVAEPLFREMNARHDAERKAERRKR